MKPIDGERMAQLAALVAEGDAPATELVEMFYILARSLLRKPISTKDGRSLCDVDDMVQEAVLACCSAAAKFRKGEGSAYSFFRVVITREVSSLRKKLTRQCRLPEHTILSLDALLAPGAYDDWLREDPWDPLPASEPSKCARQDFLWHRDKHGITNPKLTESQKQDIVDWIEGGMTQREVAQQLGVHPSTVSKILKRRKQ